MLIVYLIYLTCAELRSQEYICTHSTFLWINWRLPLTYLTMNRNEDR